MRLVERFPSSVRGLAGRDQLRNDGLRSDPTLSPERDEGGGKSALERARLVVHCQDGTFGYGG